MVAELFQTLYDNIVKYKNIYSNSSTYFYEFFKNSKHYHGRSVLELNHQTNFVKH